MRRGRAATTGVHTEVPARSPSLAAATLVATAALTALASLPQSPRAFAQDRMDEGEMRMGGLAGTTHDRDYFARHVQPLLDRECAGCHDADDPDNETNYSLLAQDADGAWSDEATDENLEMLRALLHPPAPERSRLLGKLAPMARGGVDHDGGKADGDDFDESLLDPKGPLVSWIFGASASDAPPVAVLSPWAKRSTVGETVTLDGSLSFDPDKQEVRLEWEVVESPLGSSARLSAARGAKTELVPDRPGPWVVRCRPRAGGLTGWPVLVRFDVARATTRPDGDSPSATGPIPSEDRRLTRRLCFDLLGRSPVEDELQRLAALPYRKRVDELLASEEAWRHWLNEEAFYFLLIDRFRPVSDRLSGLPAQMGAGEAGFVDAHRTFALSAEFNARNPGNDTYVTVVFEQFLGIEVQKAPRLLKSAKEMYDGKKSRIFRELGSTQSDVVRITLAQPDYVDHFARRMELRYLGEPLGEAEHQRVVDRLTLDPQELRAVLREWLVSDAYAGKDRTPRAKDEHQFIRGLFVDLLARPPGLQEFRNMRNALQALTDPAPLRGVLAKVMLDSGAVLPPKGAAVGESAGGRRDRGRDGGTSDGTKRRDRAGAVSAETVTDLFHRLLGRDPTAAELAAFTQILSEPGATWRTAALALLTSSQYQYY